MICVDCKEDKKGEKIESSWQYGSNRNFVCLCVECYNKRMKRKIGELGE